MRQERYDELIALCVARIRENAPLSAEDLAMFSDVSYDTLMSGACLGDKFRHRQYYGSSLAQQVWQAS